MSAYALIPAAGSGTRIPAGAPKQYLPLAGRPMLWHSLRALCVPRVESVFVILAPEDKTFATHDWSEFGDRLQPLYCGGETRRDSVYNGLVAAMAVVEADDWMLVHDAARPCLPAKDLDNLMREIEGDEVGGILALPVVDTIKKVSENRIQSTEERSQFWLAQTPQMFRAGLLAQALARRQRLADRRGRRGGAARTQAARGLRQPREPQGHLAGGCGDRRRHFAGARMRIGQGLDVHAFATGRKLMIGGVEIPHHKGLAGHSDADVLLHAICDALLGAAGLGDIGHHYPDTDPAFSEIDSRKLLRDVAHKLAGLKLKVVNIDATIVAEAPRMAPHVKRMAGNIAADLGIEPSAVNIKATTTERLGFIGRGEGIAAMAVVLVD